MYLYNWYMLEIFLIWFNFPFSRVLEQVLEEQVLQTLHLVLVGVSLHVFKTDLIFSFLWFILIEKVTESEYIF